MSHKLPSSSFLRAAILTQIKGNRSVLIGHQVVKASKFSSFKKTWNELKLFPQSNPHQLSTFTPNFHHHALWGGQSGTGISLLMSHAGSWPTTGPTFGDLRSFHTMTQRLMTHKTDDLQKAEKVNSSKSITDEKPNEKGSTPSTSTSKPPPPTLDQPLSRQAKLKQAVKDYGATVLVFHISMSLCSLGMFYILVSSGLDVVGLLGQIGIGEKILQSKITEGATTFVVAYAVHKVFAPVRITITLTATPLIVKKLRGMGILKAPKTTKSS